MSYLTRVFGTLKVNKDIDKVVFEEIKNINWWCEEASINRNKRELIWSTNTKGVDCPEDVYSIITILQKFDYEILQLEIEWEGDDSSDCGKLKLNEDGDCVDFYAKKFVKIASDHLSDL